MENICEQLLKTQVAMKLPSQTQLTYIQMKEEGDRKYSV